MACQQKTADGLLGLVNLLRGAGLHDHIIGLRLRLIDPGAPRLIGNEDHVVIVLSARVSPTLAHDTDDFERRVPDDQLQPQGIGHLREKMLVRLVAYHHQRSQIAVFHIGEVAALGNAPMVNQRHLLAGRKHIDLLVGLAIAHRDRVPNDGHYSAYRRQLPHGGQIVFGDLARRSAAGRRLAAHIENGCSHGAHLLDHFAPCALAYGQHDDHRGHADHDAQQGQAGAHPVHAHAAPGTACSFGNLSHPGYCRRCGVALRGQWRNLCAALNAIGSTVIDDTSIADFDDTPCLSRNFAVMRDHDDGVSRIGQLTQQSHHLGAAMRVKRPGRFVGQNDVAAIHQRPRNGHTLLLTAR